MKGVLSGGNPNYEQIFKKWGVLRREVEESKKILDTRFEKLPLEAQVKVSRRHALFLKKFDRIISMEKNDLDRDGCHKIMKDLEKYTIKVNELLKYLCLQSYDECAIDRKSSTRENEVL